MKKTLSALGLSLVIFSTAELRADEQELTATSQHFFERLDTNEDGKVTLAEAPAEGKMLVEFMLSRAEKKKDDHLSRQDFMRLASVSGPTSDHHHVDEKAVAATLADGKVQRAPENCPACAMGLTAEFVFKRLDVDEDKLVTVTDFRRSPGMDDEAKAREVVGRLDKTGDGKLSWEELNTAYEARHANCKKPDPATLAAIAAKVRPDGRGDGNRFAQVFIMRSDKDGDGKIDKSEFRGGVSGFQRLDKNNNGFIEVDELGELHQRRLNDPKSMKQRLEEGDIRRPPQDKRPKLSGQEKEQEKLSADNPISPMKLLAGYKQERLESDDTDYGRIFKKGGADFEYDIGPGALNPNDFASPKEEISWSRTQVTAKGEKVYVELRKYGILNVCFPESIARFSGRARGPEDIADILLMVMTF